MKIIATAAIVTFCGFLQIAFSNGRLIDFRTDIAHKQQLVSNTTERLMVVQDDMSSPDSISGEKEAFYHNVTSIVGAAKKDVEDAVKTAIAAGKITGSCGDVATASFDALNTTAFAEFDLCKKNITTFVLHYLNNIDTAIMEGHKVGLYLASIAPNCFNTDVELFETCVAGLVQNTTAQVESFTATAENILNNPDLIGDAVTGLVLIAEWAECMQEAGDKAVTAAAEHKTIALNCIAAL